MDADRFDTLARSLTVIGSCRWLGHALAGLTPGIHLGDGVAGSSVAPLGEGQLVPGRCQAKFKVSDADPSEDQVIAVALLRVELAPGPCVAGGPWRTFAT